jgi:hypothetical protein
MSTDTRALSLIAVAVGILHISLPGVATPRQSRVVIENPVNYTPVLRGTTAIPRPHVDAMASLNGIIFAGGVFDRVQRPGSSSAQAVRNFVAFSAKTGGLKDQGSGYKDPTFNGPIHAIAVLGDNVFVGGAFTTVNGISRRALVKIDAATGKVDTAFNAGFSGGIVWDLKAWNGPSGKIPVLVVAGSVGSKLMALNPRTGTNTGYFKLGIRDAIPGARGDVAVFRMAIHGSKLVATGNFRTVQGKRRVRFFMAHLGGSGARINKWYYPGFAKACSSTDARRIAYLQGIDFAPDGSYFVVTATGQIPASKADIWPKGSAKYHTVCDAAARFNLANDQKPAWINYTGGDSVWEVAATGTAVYVQGHFEWLDNPNGWASRDGGGAVRRQGIGAINPATGKALAWNPAKPAVIGGKVFLVTSQGMWVGSDSLTFAGEPHRGIAFVPLP